MTLQHRELPILRIPSCVLPVNDPRQPAVPDQYVGAVQVGMGETDAVLLGTDRRCEATELRKPMRNSDAGSLHQVILELFLRGEGTHRLMPDADSNQLPSSKSCDGPGGCRQRSQLFQRPA